MAEHWIQKATQNKGALHRKLHVPQGQKIPAGKLSAAASKGGTIGKEARLAETLKKLNHSSYADSFNEGILKKAPIQK